MTSQKCPLKIYGYEISYNSIGIPEVTLKYKNKGTKIIKAFSVKIYCYNAYNEPLTPFGKSYYAGISDDENLKPNETNDSTWTMNLFDTTKKVKVKIYKVLFSDGTIWKG